MQPQTEEFLNFLSYFFDHVMRPVYRNVGDSSYEAWAYSRGLRRQVKVLERAKLIEAGQTNGKDRLYRLTEQGRLHVLGGRDPAERWARSWDGRWRLVVFDVPTPEEGQRARLRRYLRDKGFGWLQRSVWITPDPLDEEATILRSGEINVQSLILLEALPCAGESQEQIVSGAWDFPEINRRYGKYVSLLEERPKGSLTDSKTATALRRWAAMEREAWLDAVCSDPLLPGELLPKGYTGKTAWEKRTQAIAAARDQLESFSGSTTSLGADAQPFVAYATKLG